MNNEPETQSNSLDEIAQRGTAMSQNCIDALLERGNYAEFQKACKEAEKFRSQFPAGSEELVAFDTAFDAVSVADHSPPSPQSPEVAATNAVQESVRASSRIEILESRKNDARAKAERAKQAATAAHGRWPEYKEFRRLNELADQAEAAWQAECDKLLPKPKPVTLPSLPRDLKQQLADAQAQLKRTRDKYFASGLNSEFSRAFTDAQGALKRIMAKCRGYQH